MDKKIGLLMDLPDGKRPGYYAQIVKALAGTASLFDRDKEMLIVNTVEDVEAVNEVMSQYKVGTELMELILLPANAEVTPLWSDYGFTSRSERYYLYAKLISAFRFKTAPNDSDQQQAQVQMEEHLIARFRQDDDLIFLADKQLEQLMLGIAKAYKCEIEQLVV